MTAPNIKLIATDLDGTFLGEDFASPAEGLQTSVAAWPGKWAWTAATSSA